jgi:hypothetical protein
MVGSIYKIRFIPYLKNDSYNFNEFHNDFNYTMKKANINLSDLDHLINKIKSLLKKSYFDFKNTKYEKLKIMNASAPILINYIDKEEFNF